MPRRIKEPALPAGPPPDASLLGIPPELRNAIYRLVADDIDQVSIIGHRLRRSTAESSNHAWLWNAMAKHPLSQTCRQLRQEFDPIHRCRAITAGVAQYRLELENFDVDRVEDFARLARSMPQVVRDRMREAGNSLDWRQTIIRFNLTDQILPSIRNFEKKGRLDLVSTFEKLQYGLGMDNKYRAFHSHEINLNFKTRNMSPAQKRITPTHELVTRAREEMKEICDKLFESLENRNRYTPSFLKDEVNSDFARYIYRKLDETHKDYFNGLRRAREKRAIKALEERLESKLKARLRDELKAELRVEIMNELKGEAEAELERQILEGFESWSTG